ncbi:MAG: DUF2207 domain-containing protein [Anaerococcus sp.]|nr:DUF2207 domain-containing protein [Peptoniphilaceae bacterium]MDY3054800.1 DUF2207 domain-containing protein [Anaerococcus sp.]
MNIIKKIRVFLIGLILSFTFSIPAYADELNSLDINVDIDKDGVASVEEVWDSVDEKGTEKFKPIENLGDIKIEDFKARVNGRDFTEENPWNLDASFEDKAYKYGINRTEKGIELCWGISNYGSNRHEISYKINPLIISLNDYDMLFWQFINSNMTPPPKSASITIKGYEPFDDQVRMWGFGMEGDIHNKDEAIVMKSSGSIAYGTVMLRFPKGYFNSSYHIDKTFNDYADQAVIGSKWEDKQGQVSKTSSSASRLSEVKNTIAFRFFIGWIIFIIAIFTLWVFIIMKIAKKGTFVSISNLDRNNKLPKPKSLDGKYYRQIPYEGEMEDLYIFNRKAFKDFRISNMLNAFILKWIYQGNLQVIEGDPHMLGFGKKKDSLKIINRPENMAELEEEFFDKIEDSLKYSKDGYVSEKSFKKYANRNLGALEHFYESFGKKSPYVLEEEGYIDKIEYRKLLFKKENLDPTEKGIELFEKLIMFRNYLKDYSLIREREVDEVKLWDHYMIYAALFGISKEVFKNLQEVYPGYETSSVYTFSTINFARSFVSVATPESNVSFNSAGGGGSTSFGGGGGSFGGGSGGGSR